MKKLIAGFFALAASFSLLWYGFSRIDWESIFFDDDTIGKLENGIGDLYMKFISETHEIITDTEANTVVDTIHRRLCVANGIDPDDVSVYIARSEEVNAFAMPGGNLVIFTALIEYCLSAEELAGVMAHELAHLQKGHIMKKLTREIGFAALTGMITSGHVGAEAARVLTSTAYDRSMETEADDTAIDYMQTAAIDPSLLANVMFRLSLEQNELIKNLSFLSTHPDPQRRAERILDLSMSNEAYPTPIVTDDEWADAIRSLREPAGEPIFQPASGR